MSDFIVRQGKQIKIIFYIKFIKIDFTELMHGNQYLQNSYKKGLKTIVIYMIIK